MKQHLNPFFHRGWRGKMKAILKKSQASEPFTFSFVDDAGKMIVKSENYAAKKSAQNGMESVKKNSQTDTSKLKGVFWRMRSVSVSW